MFQVVKRDGEIDEFKIGKITAAIHKAFEKDVKWMPQKYSEKVLRGIFLWQK